CGLALWTRRQFVVPFRGAYAAVVHAPAAPSRARGVRGRAVPGILDVHDHLALAAAPTRGVHAARDAATHPSEAPAGHLRSAQPGVREVLHARGSERRAGAQRIHERAAAPSTRVQLDRRGDPALMLVSIVAPAYNEAATLEEFITR